MKLYSIRNWSTRFETSETRKLKSLAWWPKPNKHDGLGYRRMANHDKNVQLYCAWNLICDVASKGTQDTRGSLERDGQPLTADDLACMTGFPAEIFTIAFAFFSSAEMRWLQYSDFPKSTGTPGEDPGTPGEETLKAEHLVSDSLVLFPGDSPGTPGFPPAEGKGTEGKESTQNGKDRSGWSPDAIQLRLSALYHRRQTTVWSASEQKSYKAIGGIQEDDLRLIESYYTADIPQKNDIRRRDLLTLLNNWNGELDRARKFRPARSNPCF